MKQSFKNLFVALIGLGLSSTALHAEATATGIGSALKDSATGAAKAVTDKAKATKDAAGKAASAAKNKTKDVATGAVDKTKEAASTVADKTKSAAKATKDAATTATDKTKDAATKTTTAVKDKAAAAKTKAQTAVTGQTIPMYTRVDAIDQGAKTFSQTNRKGETSVNKVTAASTINNGEAKASFSDIKVGDMVSGSRTKNADGTYNVVKITKFAPAPASNKPKAKTSAAPKQ